MKGCAPCRNVTRSTRVAASSFCFCVGVIDGHPRDRRPGRNRPPPFAKDQLKAIIARIEKLEEEKKALSDDIRDVYAEAKGTGFDVKALRTVVRMRKQDANERQEQEAILETYLNALGML